MMSPTGLLAYGSYLPAHRLDRAEIGATLRSGGGRGARVVASFDEDSTTMGVEAARTALAGLDETPAALDVWFSTTSPAYLDKTNAAAVHVALGLGGDGFAADLAGSARSGVAALRGAAAGGGLAILSDVRVGLPGSGDERTGADAAAAFVFGASEHAIAHIVASASVTSELLDRWRSPGRATAEVWEERFGYKEYAPLVRRAAADALVRAGLDQADHVVVVSPNAGVVKKAGSLVRGAVSTSGSVVGHAGTADLGVALAAALDVAQPGETILALSAVDGCDALLMRATAALPSHRQPVPVADQLDAGTTVPYATYLTWRNMLVREAPRRPEPDRPAGPPSARSEHWKFGFTGSRCTACGFVHLPPARVCRKCGAVDQMSSARLADATGAVATYTVDRLAFSPSPPLVNAVVNFDGGGRYALEVADADPDDLRVGSPVALVFRRLYTAGGVHNYFWKARLIAEVRDEIPTELTTTGGA